MSLQLLMIFACVAVGLFAPRFGARQQIVVAALATAMTALYLIFGARFM